MNREWIGISDMMSGLMLVFLFIAISYMVKVEAQMQTMKDVAIEYRDTKANLNEALYGTFEDDLADWNASITKDNSIIFGAPEVLFEVSKSALKNRFKSVLDEFFPRYIKVLTAEEYINDIEALRVEGHTSKSWKNASSPREIYLKNMQLSQARAYNVLAYCYEINSTEVDAKREWLEQHFRANGMAYAKLKEADKARRVEFRVVMKSENRVMEILK